MAETMNIKEFTQTLNNHTLPLHEMKPVVLGLYCYRQMSDKLEYYMNKVLLEREYDEILDGENAWYKLERSSLDDVTEINIEIDENIRMEFRDINKRQYNDEYPKIKQFTYNYLRYFIEPDYLFSEIASKLNRGQDVYEDLTNALSDITDELIDYTQLYNAIEGENESLDKLNIFQDINLKIFEDKKELLNDLILNISKLDFNMEDDKIVISNYEYLTDYFVNNTRDSQGFTTAHSISKLIAKIVTPRIKEYTELYDPAVGTGTIYIDILKEIGKIYENKIPTISTYQTSKAIFYYLFFHGNEINQSTYNQAIMNFFIHNIPYYNIYLNNTNTIDNPKKFNRKYDIVISDLPLGLKYQGDIEKLSEDPRFKEYPKLPKRNTDYIFLLDMVYNLREDGILATTISPKSLFAEGNELKIRKQLIENNYIDAVIKLPPKMDNRYSIEPIILIIRKLRDTTNILFIDASKEYVKGKINKLSEENIQKIVKTYYNDEEISKYSYNASIEEIIANNYNLSTKLYVDNYEEIKIDVKSVKDSLQKIQEEIRENDEQLQEYFKDKENIFGL